MHPALTPIGNLLLAVTFAMVAAVLTLLFSEMAMLPVVGVVLGLCAGAFQAKALRTTPDAFVTARTPRAVRRAFIATRSGKAAIALQWAHAFVLLALLTTIARDLWFFGVTAGYAAFMATREIVSFPTARWVWRSTRPVDYVLSR